MRITAKNSLYDILVRVSRYYIPLVGTIYIVLSSFWNYSQLAIVLAGLTLVHLALGMLLMVMRSQWKPSDTLIIDDRPDMELTFGFESGRLFEDLKHDSILTLHIRKLHHEIRDGFDAHSDPH